MKYMLLKKFEYYKNLWRFVSGICFKSEII